MWQEWLVGFEDPGNVLLDGYCPIVNLCDLELLLVGTSANHQGFFGSADMSFPMCNHITLVRYKVVMIKFAFSLCAYIDGV